MKKYLTFIFITLINTTFAQVNSYAKLEVANKMYNQSRLMNVLVYKNNIEIYRFHKVLTPHQSIPLAEVLDNGNVVLAHSLEGIVEFYDTNGKLLVENKYYTLPPYNEQNLVFSKGSKNLAILISENQNNRIIIFNNSGLKQDSLLIEQGLVTGFSFSKRDDFLAVSLSKWTEDVPIPTSIFYDLKQNKYFNLPVNFDTGIFDIKNNFFLGYTNHSLFLINILSKNVLWDKKYTEGVLLTVDFHNNDFLYVLVQKPNLTNGQWVYPAAELRSINVNGEDKVIYKYNSSFEKIVLTSINNKLILEIDGKKEKLMSVE